MTLQTFQSDGVEIAYLDSGPAADRAAVLLIHGFASNIDMNWVSTGWVEVLEQAGYRVVAIDNRGHGQSEKLYDLEAYGAPLMAEDARRLLDHLSIDRAHVIGYSMGARIAAFLALAHPDRVRSLTFGGLGINRVRGMAGTGPIANALEAPTIEDVKNPTARTFRAFAEQTKSDLEALAACMSSHRVLVGADELATIKAPTLVVVGEDDTLAGPVEPLVEAMLGAEGVVLPGRDHMKAVGDKTYKLSVLDFLDRRP